METPEDELPLKQVAEMLGVSRSHLTEILSAENVVSRLEITPQGRAQRLVRRADVEKLLTERRQAAESQTGKGRPIKVPKGTA